jgi:hypothetical protein
MHRMTPMPTHRPRSLEWLLCTREHDSKRTLRSIDRYEATSYGTRAQGAPDVTKN